MVDQQFIVLDLSAVMSGGQVAVGPMSLTEALLWNSDKTGTMVVALADPTELTRISDVEQACQNVVAQWGPPASARKIQAIKELRTIRHTTDPNRSGLKECKDDIDRYFANNPNA